MKRSTEVIPAVKGSPSVQEIVEEDSVTTEQEEPPILMEITADAFVLSKFVPVKVTRSPGCPGKEIMVSENENVYQ